MRRVTAFLLVVCGALAAAPNPAAAARPWRMIRGRNVIVVGQDSPRTLRDVAVRIEQFRLTLGGLIRGASQPLSTPTLVMAFESSAAMKPFVPLYNGKPISVGGLCFCGRTDDTNMIMASLAGFEASSSVVFHGPS